MTEADMTGDPSIKDAKPAKKTNVKYDPHMKVMAPQVKEQAVMGQDSEMRRAGLLLIESVIRKGTQEPKRS